MYQRCHSVLLWRYIRQNVSNDNQNMKALTVLEPTLAIVRRTLSIAAQVTTVDCDVVALSLIPDQDLLCALSTCTLVLLAPDGRFRGGKRGGGRSAGDHALESLHVNVRLAAPIRNLEDVVN